MPACAEDAEQLLGWSAGFGKKQQLRQPKEALLRCWRRLQGAAAAGEGSSRQPLPVSHVKVVACTHCPDQLEDSVLSLLDVQARVRAACACADQQATHAFAATIAAA